MQTLFPLLLAGLTATAVSAGECKFSQNLDFDLSATDLSQLNLKAGAGSLEIQGQSADNQVVVSALACASSQKRLDSLRLSHEVDGDRLVIVAKESKENWTWSGNNYGYIDLVVSLPARFTARVDDGSGPAIIRQIAALTIDDGSGNLHIEDITGDVSVEDGSGNVVVDHVAGHLTISDGSGTLRIANIQGDVRVREDGSGDIRINDVVQDVVIDDDGSGAIDIAGVGGNVLVGDDGSGTIKVRNVRGDFRVDDDSNGGIEYSNIDGAVKIPEDKRRVRH